MKVKLKTKEQLIDEFGFEEWWEGEVLNLDTVETKWWLPGGIIKLLGTEIEVEESLFGDFTHKDKNGYYYNEQWFEKIEEETKNNISKNRYLLILRYIMYVMRKRNYTKQTIIEKTVKIGKSHNVSPAEVENVLMTSVDFYI